MYGIFTYIWLKNMVNVGRYTSPIDGMGERLAPPFIFEAGLGLEG